MSRSATPSATKTLNHIAPPKALTVAQVVSRIKAVIEGQFPAPIWVEGELSNCSYPASGHIYFDLVDEQMTDRRGQRLLLPCAFFRYANQGLKFTLENGGKVLCLGEIATYEAKGEYQLRVLKVEPKGIGALQLAFAQLKKRLELEGLFDERHKRTIPKVPERVGIVTSRTGSAIHDMLIRLRGRFNLVLLPVKVQGDGAPQEIAEAIKVANARKLADVLIVGRGGGSIEDLWAFNEEIVARSIYASRIPVISAVGHEDHWAISDYVADLRASTPTHAAQILAHEQELLIEQSRELVQRLREVMVLFLGEQMETITQLNERLRLLHPKHQLNEYTNRTRGAIIQLLSAMRHRLAQVDKSLEGIAGKLQALSPLAVLARGYSITFKMPGRRVMIDTRFLHPGDTLETKLARGRVVSSVISTATNHSESHDADA